MDDILFPSPSDGKEGFAFNETADMPWEKKHNRLYWAGLTTGALERQQRLEEVPPTAVRCPCQEYRYLMRDQDGHRRVVTHLPSPIESFNVSFTEAVQCRDDLCMAQQAFFDIRPRGHPNAALKSRSVFDIDGSGISGQFIKLLASRLAVLKTAILREWHGDRLVPWLHYMPVGLGMEELLELVSWFTGTEQGQCVAKNVAEEGRLWAPKALREEDRAVHVYRLLLELARIQDPDRPPMKV